VAVLGGLALGVLVWGAAGYLTKDSVLPDRANARSYKDLQRRVTAAATAVGPVSDQELKAAFDALRRDIKPDVVGEGWASGAEYVQSWRDLHSVEERLIEHTGNADLAATLQHDLDRIAKSPLDRPGTLLTQDIARAKDLIAKDPDGVEVRHLLRSIRTRVNEYRDKRFAALVAERNDLELMTTLLSVVICVAFAITILLDAPKLAIMSVAGYYLAGLVGWLFTSVVSGTTKTRADDIYGYGRAQMRRTAAMSGTAAILGVPVVWLIGTGAGASELTMADLTSALSATPANLLVAGVFGMTPKLLVDRVSAWATTYVREIDQTDKEKTTEEEKAG